MGKPFSEMTPLERIVNRNRLNRGLPANFAEDQMQAEIERQLSKALNDFSDARRMVGAAMPTLALDSATDAADVYRMALDRAGVPTDGLAGDALKAAWTMFQSGQIKPRIRSYGAEAEDFAARFPNASRVKNR